MKQLPVKATHTYVAVCLNCVWSRRYHNQAIDQNAWRTARRHHTQYPDHHVIVVSSALRVTSSFTPETPIPSLDRPIQP